MNPRRLRHAVLITLVQIDAARTPPVHPQVREPSGKVLYLPPVVITAQLGLNKTNAYRQRPGGDDPQSDGHLVVRVDDLAFDAPGIAFHKGDRVTQLYADQAVPLKVNWHIVSVEPRAHYGTAPTLWFLEYQDLKTQAQVSGG